jgi:tRNA(Ile)-lysidine synthase
VSSPADGRGAGLRPGWLLERLHDDFPLPSRYLVAYSGGLDSTVLLELLQRLRDRLPAPLAAVHVDHGLSPRAGQWAAHCRAVCAGYDIPLTTIAVQARAAAGESPEAAARRARYGALGGILTDGAMLLTAHHRDDQAETLLLQLLRGAGVDGLAAMPALRRWQRGWHARPLLPFPRAALRTWADAQGLRWVEDPSNGLQDADRNYLRHAVMPLLEARWPAAGASVARSAALCAEAAATLEHGVRTQLDAALGDDRDRLRLAALRPLPDVEQRRLLRLWLKSRGIAMPSERRLREALRQLLTARDDAGVAVPLAGRVLRRYRGAAWLTAPATADVPVAPIDWDGEPFSPGAGLGLLTRRLGPGGIDPRRWQRGRVQLGYRVPGWRCRPAGRSGTRSFKALVQERGIPPWQRRLLPSVLIDGEIASLANCCVCSPFAAAAGEPGWLVEWRPDTSA